MKKTQINILIYLGFLFALTFSVIHYNEKLTAQQDETNEAFANQSLGVMMYINDEVFRVMEKYEQHKLTDADLQNHYETLDKYVVSVYNQQPDAFIFNVRLFRFIKEKDAESFDESTYNAYKEINGLFNDVYIESCSDKYGDNPYAYLYDVFSGEEFNAELEDVLLSLQ